MLFRKHIVSTRTLFQLAAAVVFLLVGVEAAVAANSGIAPLLVPYTVNTIAGSPQFGQGTTSVPVGYFGEGVPASPTFDGKAVKQGATLNGPFAMAVDSVGNVYIVDTANFIIREVNAQTGLINTIAGIVPKGCSGVTCTLRVTGCADGVPANGAAVGSAHMEGIAVDAYGNVYFDDNTLQSVSVIYRGGTQVANFIKLVNPAGVAKSGGNVLPGYVYHVGGTVNLTTCSGTSGSLDGSTLTSGAFEDAANPGTLPGAQLKSPALLTLDSAGNIYIADTGNATVRVINTQATTQTFFQYQVPPGYMRSITNCNSALTAPCPSGTVTGQGASPQLNTGINGPVNQIVFQSQYKEAEVDAFGNIYQLNGTGSSTGPPGIYAAAAYAGGAPLTNLLTAEAPSLSGYYGPADGNTPAELPLTYGNSYIAIGNPSITSTLPGSYPDVMATQDEDFDIRPSSLLPDNFGTFWFMDNHYPELNRIDQYTSLATLFLKTGRATASISPINTSSASFTNPWYCVYGSTSSNLPWTAGPQTYDPQGDGCPAVVAYFTGGNYQTVSDGLGNIFVGDANEQLEREMTVNNAFPPTAVGTATPVTQGIQVHFNSNNPPVLGPTIADGPVTGNTTTSFSIPSGSIPDFTIDVTDPEFPLGSLIGGSAYGNNSKTTNFAMFAGLPTCTQFGVYPRATPVADYDCLVYVTFNPTAPGIRQSQLKVTTANGSVYNFSLSGVGLGGQLAIDGGAPAVVPATGLGTTAGIAVTQSGTIYIADPTNNRIVVEPAGGGTQSNLTFTGVTPATLSGPMGVAVDSAANVYISDTGNNRVLKVNPLTGVATVLGNYVWVPGNPSTAPPQYAFNKPQGLAVDASNNVYVADTGNSAVVEIPSNIALGGAVPLLNYSGAPKFSAPVAVAVDAQGNIYVADNKVAGGVVVELPPGGGDLVNVPGSQFLNTKGGFLSTPNGVAVDAAGNVYVSDSSSNTVYEIPSASGQNPAFALNFPGLSAPAGLALDANGNLYVADSGNKQVLFDYRQNPTVNFGNVPQNLAAPAQPLCSNTIISDGFNIGTSGAGCVLTVTNIGSQSVTLTNPITSVVGAGNAAYSMTNTCTSPLPAGRTCTISPTFAPTADNGQSESVNVNGGPQSLSLTANGAQPLVNIVLSAAYTGGTSTTTPTAGATATITATLTQPHIVGNTPTGSVTFTYKILGDGTTGTQVAPLSGGNASFALPTLLQGRKYTINADYSGDPLNSSTQAAALVLQVPGVPVTVTAASVSFTYGSAPPAIVGTVTGITDPLVTYKFTSAASATTPINTCYPVTVVFSGGSFLTYGFPPALTAGGAPACVTENPALLTYTIPNFTSQYGAADLSYGANAVSTGAVNGDTFSATFTPASSSILNVGTYKVTPTVTGPKAGNYTVTAPPSTLTITQAPVSISITAAQTSVLNTTAGVATAIYQISVSTAVSAGKGTPSGSVTVSDVFTPITSTGYGTTVAPATSVVPLVAAFGTVSPFAPAVSSAFPNGITTPGIHQYSFSYSGDSNFQTGQLVPNATAAACIPSAITVNCLIVDNPDFTLTSPTGPIAINPGTVPSGNGLPVAPNQSTAFPESAVLFVNKVNGFVGQVTLTCQTQNPAYVSCFMTPQTVCFAATSTTACTNTGNAAATVLGVQTPATLPLGFKFTSQLRTSASKTMLAFLPFGFLAFCVRRRRRLSKALWMLMVISAVSAGMSGCGGNHVAFYTPIPTGPQTVTVTATYLGNGGSQPAATRTFVVPINID